MFRPLVHWAASRGARRGHIVPSSIHASNQVARIVALHTTQRAHIQSCVVALAAREYCAKEKKSA